MSRFTKPGLSHSPSVGGTGICIDRVDQGAILIGNGVDFDLTTITAGAGVDITNGSGTIQISTTSAATVSSVNLSTPSELNVSGGPITSSGTLALSWSSQPANKVFSSPDGSAGTPGFRNLVATDIPNLDASKITTGLLVTARGGLGLDTSGASNGSILYYNAGAWHLLAAGAVDQFMKVSVGLLPSWSSNAAMVWERTWSSVIAYRVGDTVFYNGASYVCITNNTNNAPSVSTGDGAIINTDYTTIGLPIYFGNVDWFTSGAGLLKIRWHSNSNNTDTKLDGVETYFGGYEADIDYTIPLDATAHTVNLTNDVGGGGWNFTVTGQPNQYITISYGGYSIIVSPATDWDIMTTAVSNYTTSAHAFLAGPTSGLPSAPTFRGIVLSDIPTMDTSHIPNLDTSKLTTGQLATARGGTGLDTSGAANGQLLIGTGTGLALATLTAGSGITITNTSGHVQIDGVTPASLVDTITFVLNGGGAAITTGVMGDLLVPYACTINQVTMLADQTTSTVLDIWKQVYASFPPTVTQKITASAPPTLASAVKSQDSTLTGWTTSIAAGDILRFNMNSNTAATFLTITLKVTRL